MSTSTIPRSKSTGVISSSSPATRAGGSARAHSTKRGASTSRDSPLVSPHQEREDPFSLAGFFPTQRSASMDQFHVNFQWTQRIGSSSHDDVEEEDEEVVESPVESDEMLPRTPGLMHEDGYAHGVLSSEDKLGVLALNTDQLSKTFNGVFASPATYPHEDADERLFSPYADEDPVDDESLCSALRARRRAQTQPTPSSRLHAMKQRKAKTQKPAQSERFGELFLPGPPSKAAPTQAPTSGWTVPLYKQVQEFVESL